MEVNYDDQVGLALLNLGVGAIFIIADNVKPQNKDRFIASVKSYMDRNFGKQDGWEIAISSDYTKLKKQPI